MHSELPANVHVHTTFTQFSSCLSSSFSYSGRLSSEHSCDKYGAVIAVINLYTDS